MLAPIEYVEKIYKDNIHITLIANRAMCAEFLLKAFYIEQGNDHKNGHYLRNLFNQLCEDSKNEIRNTVNVTDFDETLNKASNEFVEWRYLETGSDDALSSDTDFMNRFINALSDY